jgi:hypothetical protein
MSKNKSTVLVLAGISGSGKTTLLRRAYHHGIPVFGEESKEIFLATNQARGPEQHIFEDAVPTRLFQGKHVAALLALPERPDFFVLHLDLLNLLLALIDDPLIQAVLPAHLRQTEPKQAEDLLDKNKTREIFVHYLRNAFAYADSIIVNTLQPPFQKNAQQWNERADFLKRTAPHVDVESFKFMFDQSNPRQDIHDAIHAAWFEAVKDAKCERAYVSRAAQGVLEVTKILPEAAGSTKYPFGPVNKAAGSKA